MIAARGKGAQSYRRDVIVDVASERLLARVRDEGAVPLRDARSWFRRVVRNLGRSPQIPGARTVALIRDLSLLVAPDHELYEGSAASGTLRLFYRRIYICRPI